MRGVSVAIHGNGEHAHKPYKPLFAEELFIANLYGTPEEIELLLSLICNHYGPDTSRAIDELVSRIKRRQFPLPGTGQ